MSFSSPPHPPSPQNARATITPAQSAALARVSAAFGPLEFLDRAPADRGPETGTYSRAA